MSHVPQPAGEIGRRKLRGPKSQPLTFGFGKEGKHLASVQIMHSFIHRDRAGYDVFPSCSRLPNQELSQISSSDFGVGRANVHQSRRPFHGSDGGARQRDGAASYAIVTTSE